MYTIYKMGERGQCLLSIIASSMGRVIDLCCRQLPGEGHMHKGCCIFPAPELQDCRELTTLWVVRLDDGVELKVTDPKEQQ